MAPELEDALLPATHNDRLELDGAWSFGKRRANKRWLWIAPCRRTRQAIAYVIGGRSEKSCQSLWRAIPEGYKKAHSHSDFWGACQKVFPKETHRRVGKGPGQTNHVGRWDNTLRQWLARHSRKTLSFSKSDEYHAWATHLFIRK